MMKKLISSRKRKHKLTLSKKQRDKIWGEEGPYSEAKLIFCNRILDDSISRVFIDVEVAINPLTFEIIKKHREEFADDEMVQQLLDHSEFRGQHHGYISCSFSAQHSGRKTIKEANKHLKYAEDTIIRMHKWVMNYFDVNVN